MKIILPCLFLLCIFGCSKHTACSNAVSGTMKNRSGLDGCQWVIEANDKVYEPMNLHDFNSELLVDNTKVVFSFESFPVASICMMGETIKLNCLEKR